MELLAVQNQNIEGYETEDILGRGFNSIVYKGRSGDDSSAVVVKVTRIPTQFSSEDIFLDSSSLHHPNIVPTKKIGSLADGAVYSVRNYVEGETLEGMLSQRGVIDSREAMHYLAQLASAIDYIHAQDKVHGNIKPANVVVDGRFRAMLFDLGSRSPELIKSERETLPPSLAHYRSPEQLKGESVGPASDIFSLGVLAFELFTGSRPFPGRDYTAVVSNVLSSSPLTLDDVGSPLPKALEQCFAQALAKEPQQRYASAGEFVQALSRVMGTFIDEFGLVGGYSSLQATNNDLNRRVRAKTVMTMNPAELLGVSEQQEGEELPLPKVPSSVVPSSIDVEPQPPKAPTSPNFGAPATDQMKAAPRLNQPSSGSQLRVVIFALMLGLAGAIGYKFFAKDSMTVSDLVTSDSDKEADEGPAISTQPIEKPANIVPPTAVVTPPAVSSQLVAALASTSTATVRGALEEAGKQGDLAALPEMIKLADSSDYVVRIDLLKVLSMPPFLDRDESFGVVSKLLNDPEYLVRGFAAKALIASKRPEAEALIQQRLTEEKNAIVLKVLSRK